MADPIDPAQAKARIFEYCKRKGALAVGVAAAVFDRVTVPLAVAVVVTVGVESGPMQFEASQNDAAKNSLPPVQFPCGSCVQPASGSSQQSP